MGATLPSLASLTYLLLVAAGLLLVNLFVDVRLLHRASHGHVW